MFYVSENVEILTCVVVSGNLEACDLAFGMGPLSNLESTVQGEMVGKTPLLHMLSSQLEFTAHP